MHNIDDGMYYHHPLPSYSTVIIVLLFCMFVFARFASFAKAHIPLSFSHRAPRESNLLHSATFGTGQTSIGQRQSFLF